jgi:hypothetical protein
MKRVLLATALLSGSCAHAPRFTPHSTETAALKPITYPAVRAYPGDEPTLRAADARLVGWLVVKPKFRTQEASRYGATHVVEPAPGSSGTRALTVTLYRVEAERWPSLSKALRPGRVYEPPASGCSCSRVDEYGKEDVYHHYIHCGDVVRYALESEDALACPRD